MITILYTNTDKVRSILGVDDKDVDDATIIAKDLEKELRLDLTSWLPTHVALYAAGTAGGATQAAIDIADAIVLYSSQFCSLQAANSLRLAAPQAISDGRNELSRFVPIDWQKMILSIKEKVAFYKTFLLDATATNTFVSTPLFSGVGLAVDPVTSTGV